MMFNFNTQRPHSMDRLTLTAILASAAFLVFLIVTLSWHNDELRPRIWQLNEVLEQIRCSPNTPTNSGRCSFSTAL
jgi:hypothetical protein